MVRRLSHRYGRTVALDDVTLEIPARCMVGLIGPDGVGKSTLLALIAGVRRIQEGEVFALDGDMPTPSIAGSSLPRIAYMPQGLGRNLYPTLTVFENLDFFGRLFDQPRSEREWRIKDLLAATGLDPFPDRPAGKLSGGMKQKLSLCCSLIHDPDLLILDEPTTGVDPLSRRQFWELIDRIRARRPEMSVMVATAYMEEAERFDWLTAMDAGRVIATGSPAELRAQGNASTLDDAFINLLPEAKRAGHQAVVVPPARGIWGSAGDRGGGADPALRQVHSGRSRQLPHRTRRDLRLSRLQRLRQEHDDEDAHRPIAANRRRSAAFRASPRCRRHGDARTRRLHVAGLLALWRTDRPAEPGTAFPPVSPARGPESGSGSGNARTVRSARRRGQPARKPAPRSETAPAAGRRPHARSGGADPGRADLGRRSGRPRRLLALPDQPIARRRRDDLPLDPLHERSGAMRPHLVDERRQGSRRRHGKGADGAPRHAQARGRVHRLSRRRRRD